jgi:hypothetical protein
MVRPLLLVLPLLLSLAGCNGDPAPKVGDDPVGAQGKDASQMDPKIRDARAKALEHAREHSNSLPGTATVR